jgi:Zn-dependent protease
MRSATRHIHFSNVEIVDLIKAWLATSVAFAIFFTVGSDVEFGAFILFMLIAAFTAGVGFLLHELMHKFTANRFGVAAEFRSHDLMLVVMILFAFLGFIFAAPGAVQIYGHVTRKENGIISLAGPATNIILALLFMPMAFTSGFFQAIGTYGMMINALLGAFNLIPLWGFDGQKVLHWHKGWYFGTLVAAGVLVVASFAIAA